MAYIKPTFLALKARIEADLSDLALVLRTAFAVVWAKAVSSLHTHLEWVDAQCSPLTCDIERLYDWAALYGVARLNATAAAGYVLATGNIGAKVLANSILRADNGLDYKVTAAVTLGAGANLVYIKCTTVGTESNLNAGQTLVLVDPLAGVNTSLIVSSGGITGGAELEELDPWRARVVEEWQTVVSRGARSGKVEDYRAWAKNAHPSVTTALVQPHLLGIGTVVVRPICNDLVNRLPTPTVIAAVENMLQSLAPATADWSVGVPLVHSVNLNISLLPTFDTAQNRANIINAVRATINAEQSETSILAMAELDAAIATVTTQYTRLAPAADITIGAGEVFVFAGVAWS